MMLLMAALHADRIEAQNIRIRLDVLVLSDGDVGTEMVRAGLDEALVHYTMVDLRANDRPAIDAAFLSDSSDPTVRLAKYQAVVLPNPEPAQLSAAELATLESFEREFHLRELDAYTYPSASVGLESAQESGNAGSLDGMVAQATPAALSGGFGYLKGPIPFDDVSPHVSESYGYVVRPLPADPTRDRRFVSFFEGTAPGAAQSGVIIGVHQDAGRERMVVTSAMNASQLQQQLLFPGILHWLTHGVHLGHERYRLSVHVDDFLYPDSRWIPELDCTSGECPTGATAQDIIMTEADLAFLDEWQSRNGLKLDLVWNGEGLDAADTAIPASALLNDKFRWINHTYTHEYLGCIQDFSVVPWVCATAEGQIQWASQELLQFEIAHNQRFAAERGIQHDPTALVTGQHSGLRRTPVEPSDNPNLAAALSATGIRWIASDNSRESAQRQLGPALTVPRYPMNIFYNVGTKLEEVDEYNWIYTSAADGGSGVCERDPQISTCIPPLHGATGFDDYIVPEQARQMLMAVMANSPKPFYAHQSNLAEDRILYRPLDVMLNQYRELLADDCPVNNPTLAEVGEELSRRTQWQSARGRVNAYVQDQRLYISTDATSPMAYVPVTLPSATAAPELYALGPVRTDWLDLSPGSVKSYTLPESVGYARSEPSPASVPSGSPMAACSLVMLLLTAGIWIQRHKRTE